MRVLKFEKRNGRPVVVYKHWFKTYSYQAVYEISPCSWLWVNLVTRQTPDIKVELFLDKSLWDFKTGTGG